MDPNRFALHEAAITSTSVQAMAMECMLLALIATHPDKEALAAIFRSAMNWQEGRLQDFGFDLSFSPESTGLNIAALKRERAKWESYLTSGAPAPGSHG